MNTPTSLFIRSLRFLGKVQFTTVLLLAGVVIMTIGTILESRGSREIAWSAVYGTAWFDVFLFLIGVNLVIAVINRIPIQRHLWPFVLTHFAIVLLLAGAWISRSFGYEGRMMIYEGDEESQIYMEATEIRVRWHGGPGAAAGGEVVETGYPQPRHGPRTGRTLQKAAQGVPEIRIAEYLPDGMVSAEVREGPAGSPPGIEFLLSGGPRRVKGWLIADDPQFGRRDFGSVEVEFRRADPDGLAENRPHVGEISHGDVFISLSDGGAPVQIHLPENVGEEVPVGSGMVASVREFFQRARVVKGKLSETASGGLNPAAVVEIRSGSRTEVHTVFSRHPEYNAVRGREPDRPLVAAVRLAVAPRVSKPRMAIVLGPDEELHLQLTTVSGPSPAFPVAVGRSVSVTALGLDLRLERLLPNARAEFGVKPSPAGNGDGRAYVRLEADLSGTSRSLWLQRGGAWAEVSLGDGGKLAASFGPETRTLPFAIALEEFELIRYPGSSRPAEYRSRVQVKPAAANLPLRNEVISMNRPLDVAGFRLFQSSYRPGEAGKPDATILTVAYDPGVPIVYFSFLLLILGIAWGLRGVRPKMGPAELLERRRSAAAAGRGEVPRGARKREAHRARRATTQTLGMLLAAVAGLAPAPNGWAQSADPATTREVRLPVEETRGWAILADGRVKPLLTYANETALAVTGRESFDGLNALEILWGYVLNPREFKRRPYIRIDSLELKAVMGLDASEKRFAFDTLVGHRAFQEVTERALQRQREDAELSRLEKDALEAYAKIDRVAGLASGVSLTIVPTRDASGSWLAPSQLRGRGDREHLTIYQGFGRLAAAYARGDAEGFRLETHGLSAALRNADPEIYPSESAIARELFYEDFNAFGKAWKLYLVGFLAILLLGFSERPWGYAAGMALVGAGFVCHTAGLGTRWAIADRAPVSDMYESLVFMGWGAIALGLIAEAINRKRFLGLSAGLAGFVCLAFSENLPIDPAINPLVPVLAHTYWLSVHVMTVMLSYSAFAVAMVLGHVMIFFEVFQREKTALMQSLSLLLYKTLQVGVLFLAAGIIFGAVWANESWGRYWGWDPKETWSLITFFVYLAIIHARFAGWLRHFGLAVTAILGFLAVVMTYYGVNFILAAGLHAYGFSEGGRLYVAIYAVLEIAIVAGAYLRCSTAKRLPPTPIAGSDPTEA
jgi:cytochrome c-type biogenesis protein CcsB